MDPLSTTVVGSRYPITVPLAKRTSSPPHSPQANGDSASTSSQWSGSDVHARRKPAHTFKSPAAHELLSLRIEGHVKDSRSSVQHASDQTASESTALASHAASYHHLSPPLPLYHPLGTLALSVPPLDPALYGHPNAVNVEEFAQIDADAIRRSSSRARRPAAKLRDRDMADDEMSAILDGHAAVNGQVGGAGSTSPRKRRSGGGANSRRRRRENGADGTYPNPPKRTRNTRGTSAVATFASPLAGPAITPGDDDIPDGGEHVQLDSTVAASTPQEPQAATEAAGEFEVPEQRRSTRSRRSRPAGPTRRHSSASETTTTSVSVSIAANTRNTRSSGNRAYQESEEKADEQADVEMKQEDSAGERAEQVTESANPPKDAEKPPETVATPIEAPAPSDAVDEPETLPAETANEAKASEPPPAETVAPVNVPEPSDEKKAGAPELKKISSIEKKSAESPADRISKPPEEPKESKEAPEATVVAAGQPKAKEPPIPDVPRLGQKILPSSSWTRFAAPVAGPAGPNANQKKIRDEEKEEGELSEESDTPPSRER